MTLRWPPLTVRTRLIGLVLAIVLSFGAMLAWILSQEAAQAREAAYAQARVLADNAVQTLEGLLGEDQVLLARMAARPLVAALDPAHCDPLIKEYLSLQPQYTTLSLRDLAGNVICSHYTNPIRQYNETDHPWFFESARSDGFFVSDAVLGPISRRWVAAAIHPVAGAAGRPIGALVLGIDLEELSQRVLSAVPASAVVSVIDRQDRFLLRSADFGQWIGKTSPVVNNDAIRGRREGVMTTTGVDGIRRMWAYTTVTATGWRVVAGLPEAEVMAAHDRLRNQTLALGFIALLAVLAVLALAWRIASGIVAPVRALAATAARVGGGDDTARATAAGPPELQAVVQQFNQMLDARALAEQALRDQAAALQDGNTALADARRAALNLLDDAVEGRQGADAANRRLQAEAAQHLRTEQSLRRSEARSAKAEALAGYGTWDWNLAGGNSTWSDALFGIYGRRRADGVPAFGAWQETIHPDDRARLQAVIDQALAGASSYEIDFRVLTKDCGTLRHISSRGESVLDMQGRVARLWGVDQDVTQRKQAEAQLRQSADRTRRILHAAAVGLWEWNLVTDAVYFSPESKQQLGYADDEIANRFDEWEKRLHPDDLARALTAAADFRAGRVPRYAVDIRLRHRNGSWRWIHGEADLERNEKGEPVTMRGSHIDITERKQAEASAIELERQFRESQKMEAVGTLASSIAHDFNNIMGAILGNVALARQDLRADHPAALSVAQIQVAGLRARSLVQRILSFTQRQAPQMQAQPLRALVEEGIALLRATLPSGVTISRVLPVEPLVGLVDATQVNQLLMNLGINAWHALQGQAGQIEVGLEAVRFDAATPPPQPGLRPGLAAHLWVRDSGCGMTPEVLQHIFEPFFTTKMGGQGTGLGLAAVTSVVQAHGGVVDVESTPGVGTCFHIYLPALEAAALAPPQEPADPDTVPAALAADGRRVIYIDDDEIMRLLVERLLQRAGFQVSCFAVPAEALDALRAAPLDCDLVITDYNMPQMSGLDVARAVAALRADLPLILTTGSLTDELIASAMEAGVSALVNKERTFEELAPQALQLLAQSPR